MSEFFDGRLEDQPAYLFLEPERLLALEKVVGSLLASTVAASLIWREGTSVFRRHLRATEDWGATGEVGPPPCLALLAAMTEAAAAMVADHDFSSNNYRDRLCGLLGVTAARGEKLKHDLPQTVALWHALNDWLDDWGGALGIPTARVLGRFVNVGFPISQALVSGRDRQAMRQAFETYGLSPGRRVSTAEMAGYLGDWVGRGQAPANLARLWTDTSVRERIAQVACDELRHGAATIPVRGRRSGAETSSKLEWVAELALEPFPDVDFFLISSIDRQEVEGRWTPGPRTDVTGQSAVAACQDALEMRWLPDLGALSLEPWDQIGLTGLFSGVLELERRDRPGLKLLRSPTAVLVLAFDERDGRYHEVPRAQLLERCLVLAHEHIVDAVARHLTAYARPGFRKLSSDALRGLPEGWSTFVDVLLVKAAEESAHARLIGLCAAPATVVSFNRGLRIGQGTWHVRRPPEAMAVVEPDTSSFRVLLQDRGAGPTRQVLGTFVGRGVVDLATLVLSASDYEAQVEQQRAHEQVVVRRAGLRLRSADHPRSVGVQRDLGLGFDLDRPWALMSAERRSGEPPSRWLRGAVLREGPRRAAAGAVPTVPLPGPRVDKLRTSAPNTGPAATTTGPSRTPARSVRTIGSASPPDPTTTLRL